MYKIYTGKQHRKTKKIQIKNKQNKQNKQNRKNRKTIKGGNRKTVPITSIFLTDPIFKAIKSINPEFKPKGFKKDPSNQGFKLHKLNQSQDLSIPISVKPYNKNPEYFSIINGRHRFAKLVARGNSNININIINS
jgi:hypothetical protein